MNAARRALRVSDQGLAVATANWGSDEEVRGNRPVCLEIGKKYRGVWTSDDADAKLIAKALCEGCPKRRSCLQLALDAKASAGIFGGYNLGSAAETRLAEEWLGRKKPRMDRRRKPNTTQVAS